MLNTYRLSKEQNPPRW